MLYSKKSLLILFLLGTNIAMAITEAEIIENATKISNRIVPTNLEFHQLKQMWFKGDNYCLGKPYKGVNEHTDTYVQLLLDKVPSNGVCVFESRKSSTFILDGVKRELR